MHASTLRGFIHLYSPPSSLVVTMNSSIGMSSWLLFASLEQQSMLPHDKIILFFIVLQGIAFQPISLSLMMFLCWNQTMMYMKRLSNLFWKSLNLIWSLDFLFNLPQIRHLRQKHESISIMSKLTLVIIDCLFHNYSTSHFRLMFYVLCKGMQLDHSWFISFYALKDFFPSPLPNNYSPTCVEDIVWHMASLPSPKSSSSERSCDHGVLNLIGYEAT